MFKITFLAYEAEDRFQYPVADIAVQLNDAGIAADFANKSQQDLGMQPERVAQYVEQNPSDAWIVCAASKEILEWFCRQPFPTLAMYGGYTGLPIAAVSAEQSGAMKQCMKRLVEFGHQRIAMITREERRKPKPLSFEQVYLDELKAHGLFVDNQTHLPNWEESLTGLRTCLDSLFSGTAPTALIFQEAHFAIEAQQFLKKRNILIPEHVSLYCCDYSPNFKWNEPPIAHSSWDNTKIIERILEWCQNTARGESDMVQTRIETEFIESGTIGPAPADK